MTAPVTDNEPSVARFTKAAREANAKQGIRHTSEIVGAHVDGQRRAEQFLVELRHMLAGGDELMTLATDVAKDATFEGKAYARGFFRVLQKRLESAA